MSIFGLPLILFQVGKKGRKLSDTEFLSIKEFDGKIVTNTGVRTTVGDIVSLTANIGKDMYLASAKITLLGVGGNIETANIVLKINGVIIEQTDLGADIATFPYQFQTKGVKVLAGQIIKLEILSVSLTPLVYGNLQCFEEDTGVSPQIPSI